MLYILRLWVRNIAYRLFLFDFLYQKVNLYVLFVYLHVLNELKCVLFNREELC